MKAILFILCLISYSVGYGVYLWFLATVPMSDNVIKVWNYSLIGGLTLSMLILYLSGINTFMLQQFFIISFIILLVTFTVVILVNLLIVRNPYYILGIFIGANILFSLMVLIAGLRHGVFNQE